MQIVEHHTLLTSSRMDMETKLVISMGRNEDICPGGGGGFGGRDNTSKGVTIHTHLFPRAALLPFGDRIQIDNHILSF